MKRRGVHAADMAIGIADIGHPVVPDAHLPAAVACNPRRPHVIARGVDDDAVLRGRVGVAAARLQIAARLAHHARAVVERPVGDADVVAELVLLAGLLRRGAHERLLVPHILCHQRLEEATGVRHRLELVRVVVVQRIVRRRRIQVRVGVHIIVQIHLPARHHLLEVRHARNRARLLPRLRQRRQQHRRQNRDDRDHHQQLNQRERTATRTRTDRNGRQHRRNDSLRLLR